MKLNSENFTNQTLVIFEGLILILVSSLISERFPGKLIHNFTEWKDVARGCPQKPIIFERQILPQQTIYRWKGNLMASSIHLKYWGNILISRLYEQFSRNNSEMGPEWLSEKILNFQNMTMLHIILKHVIWRFR